MVEGGRIAEEQLSLLAGAQGLERKDAADIDAGLLNGRLVDGHLVGAIGGGHPSPKHAVGRDACAQRVVLRHVEGYLPIGTRDRGDVDDKPAARLDLRQLADAFDGGVVVAVVTGWAGAGGVHHHAVVVRAGLLPEPVEAAGRAPCAGEGGDGDGEAEAGDQRQCHQREVPPSPVGTHPHAD